MSLKFSRLSFLWTSKASTCKLSGEFGLRPACQLQKTAVDWPCPVSTLAVDRGGHRVQVHMENYYFFPDKLLLFFFSPKF